MSEFLNWVLGVLVVVCAIGWRWAASDAAMFRQQRDDGHDRHLATIVLWQKHNTDIERVTKDLYGMLDRCFEQIQKAAR